MNGWRVMVLWLCFQGGAGAETFDSLDLALFAPEKVTVLNIVSNFDIKQLPAQLGTLLNLEMLDLSCLENLTALPAEIGLLKKLKQLRIFNGNGCSMNVTIPDSIGQLTELRVLVLYGALDGRYAFAEGATPSKGKTLPKTMTQLRALKQLDLGRNGMKIVPPEIAALQQLTELGLDYNEITELPTFVGNLKNLRKLSLNGNDRVKLPSSLAKLSGLRIELGNNRLTLYEQAQLRKRFPHIIFAFENDLPDGGMNEENTCINAADK